MNIARTARTWTHVVTVAALLGAVVMLQGSPAMAANTAAAHKVIDLPRVEIIVRRKAAPAMQIVELPRVVITARRGERATPTQVVQAQRSNPI